MSKSENAEGIHPSTACKAVEGPTKLRPRFKGSLERAANPHLIATLTARPGEADIARAQLKLRPSAFLDNAHIGGLCTRVRFAAHACPATSIYGHELPVVASSCPKDRRSRR